MLKHIFDAITPDNIKSIDLVKDAMEVFVELLDETSQVSQSTSNVYTSDNQNIKDQLAKIYLKDLYQYINDIEKSKIIYDRFSGLDTDIVNQYLDLSRLKEYIQTITDDDFVAIKKFKEMKGTVGALEYMYNVVLENTDSVNYDNASELIIDSNSYYMDEDGNRYYKKANVDSGLNDIYKVNLYADDTRLYAIERPFNKIELYDLKSDVDLLFTHYAGATWLNNLSDEDKSIFQVSDFYFYTGLTTQGTLALIAEIKSILNESWINDTNKKYFDIVDIIYLRDFPFSLSLDGPLDKQLYDTVVRPIAQPLGFIINRYNTVAQQSLEDKYKYVRDLSVSTLSVKTLSNDTALDDFTYKTVTDYFIGDKNNYLYVIVYFQDGTKLEYNVSLKLVFYKVTSNDIILKTYSEFGKVYVDFVYTDEYKKPYTDVMESRTYLYTSLLPSKYFMVGQSTVIGDSTIISDDIDDQIYITNDDMTFFRYNDVNQLLDAQTI